METQEGFTGTDTLHLKCFFCSDLTTALIRMLLQCGLCWTFEETFHGVENVEDTFVDAFFCFNLYLQALTMTGVGCRRGSESYCI